MSLSLLGRGVLPTVKVTQRVVRFGSCPCFDRRDVVVGISNTGELPIRCVSRMLSKACLVTIRVSLRDSPMAPFLCPVILAAP